jgi:hypothetical protein
VAARTGEREGPLMHGSQPAVGGRGRGEKRGKKKWAEPAGTGEFFIYSNKIQTSSKCFDQKVDLTRSKNSI